VLLFIVSAPRPARLWLGLAAALVLGSCIEWDRSTAADPPDIRVFVSDVLTLSERSAVFHAGTPPVGGGGPVVSAALPALVLRGGAAHVQFTSDTPFSRVVISVQGFSGYYDLFLDEETTSATVLVVYAQDVGGPSFTMQYAGGSGGVLGPFQAANTAFLGNRTGDVQVNLTWNTPADVDLHVVDPFGEEYFYAHRGGSATVFGPNMEPIFVPTSGGLLDIDSNAGCATDGPRAENVFWTSGVQPPAGTYIVRVNYWSACDTPFTDYVVTVRVRGQAPRTFTGRLTGPGFGGGAGDGQRITEFTVYR
jgi:hypothetical protein